MTILDFNNWLPGFSKVCFSAQPGTVLSTELVLVLFPPSHSINRDDPPVLSRRGQEAALMSREVGASCLGGDQGMY